MNTILQQINLAGMKFVEFALPMLTQSVILILFVLLIDFFIRKKVRAVFRYWIWMLVLVKLVLPTSLTSPLSLGRLIGNRLTYVDRINTNSKPRIKLTENSPVNVPMYIDLDNIESDRFTPRTAAIISRTESTDVKIIPKVGPNPSQPAKASPASLTPLSWQGVVLLIWLAAVITMSSLLLQRAIFVKGLLKQALPANNLMNEALEYCFEHMGVKRKVGLKVSFNATSPAVCGLFRPVILLPQNLGPNLGSSHLRTVMMHELAHIKRGDLWINTIQVVLQIIYLYNPLLWLANAIIRRVREQAVDETVIVTMGPRARQYPETLLHVARLAWQRPALSLRLIGVIESKNQLKERIKNMLDKPAPKNARLGIAGIFIIIVLGVFLLPMTKAENSTAEPSSGSKQEKTDKDAEIKMLQEKIAQLQKHLQQLQKQFQQKKSQIAVVEKEAADVDNVDVVVVPAPKPQPQPRPAPHPTHSVSPVTPEIHLPSTGTLAPPEISQPPIPKVLPGFNPQKIHIPTPRIEPPQHIVQQISKVQSEKVALIREIDRLRKEFVQRKKVDNISEQEAEEFDRKIEDLEEKRESLDGRSEDLRNQMEDWGQQTRDKMEDWRRNLQEQIRQNFEQKHQEKTMQHEQQMKMHEQQMREREKQMREHEKQMQQLERQMEQLEQQNEHEHGMELEQFEHQMEHFGHQMEQWSEQYGHQMEQWAQKFSKDMDVSVEGMEDMLDNIDVEVNVDVDEKADAKADVLVDDLKDKEKKATFTKGPNIITAPLDAGKKIVVKNRFGSVNVSSGQAGQCKCSITVKASAETVEQAREKANPVKIEVNEDNEALNLIVVKTDNDEWDDINVHLDIQVPHGTDIVVAVEVGSINMNNLEGNIQANNNVGDILVSNVQGDISLITNVGSLVCEVPEKISAEVKASSNLGSIKTELPLDVIKSFQKSKISGTLGKGDNKVELRVNVGSIVIRKAKTPVPEDKPMI